MEIKLFSKPDCIYCDKVKKFITDNNLTNIEHDNSYNIDEIWKYGNLKFPMLLLDRQGIFESEIIIQVLKAAYNLK